MSERTEHTPGPWTVESGFVDGWPGLNGENMVYWIEPVPIPDSGQFEREADAVLAAAAPDLLAACEDSEYQGRTGPELLEFAADMLIQFGPLSDALQIKAAAERAAIAKARGEVTP